MRRGIGRLRAGGGGFNPASLFAAGEQGGIYDPSDLSVLFQDTAGATPVTATGQTVKRINDKSGRGNHATNATGWVLQSDGSHNYLQGDGASTFATSAFALGSDKLSIWAGTSTAGTQSVVSFGNISTLAGSFDFGYFSDGAMLYRKGSGSFGARATTPVLASPIVISTLCDLAGATQATECPALQVDGAQLALTDFGTADSGGGNFGSYALTIGGGQALFSGRLYQLIVRAGLSTLAGGESYVTQKTKPSPTFSTMVFADTASQSAQFGTYQLTSAYARAEFQTTATSFTVNTYDNIYQNQPAFTELGVYVDGVWNQSIAPALLGLKTTTISLSAGSKKVSFVNGLQAKPGAPVYGTFVTSVSANAALTPVTPGVANRVLLYGDSITVGANCTTPSKEAWAMLVRAAYYPNSVALEAWGSRSLWDDCNTAPLRATFVATLASYFSGTTGTQRVWLAIGTNDYGLNKWSAASFGVAYAALLDDLHTALPSATIFCQTPILRTTETANGSGSTLGDYRTQITTAQSTRSAFATLSDGTAYMTTASLSGDGVHPTTAGHLLYSNAVRSVLSI